MEAEQEIQKVLSRVIVQLAGKPEEHVLDSMDLMIKKIKDDENLAVANIEISDIKEEGGIFNLFAEIEITTKDIDELAWFCFDYMPASVEIIEPREMKYDAKHLTNFFNEIQTRLHSMDLVLKTLSLENKKLKGNGMALMRNMLYYLTGKDSRSLEDISKIMGIKEEEIKKIIDELISQKRIVKMGEKYKWISHRD